MRGTTPQMPRSEKEGEEVIQALELTFPCSPWCSLWWSSCAPAALGDPWGCRHPPAALGRVTHITAVCENCCLGIDSCWRSPWRTVSFWRDTTLEQGKDYSPWAAAGSTWNWPSHPFPVSQDQETVSYKD